MNATNILQKRIRLVTIKSFVCLLACLLFSTIALSGLDRDEPISYSGHGIIYDFYGKVVVPNEDFVLNAQNYYLSKIESEASSAQLANYQVMKASLQTVGTSAQQKMYVNSRLLGWFIDAVNPDDAKRYRKRNKHLKRLIFAQGIQINNSNDVMTATVFEPSNELVEGIAAAGIPNITVLFSTTLGGAAYKQECEDNSVPSPPAWGHSDWGAPRGDLSNPFISASSIGRVYTYTSSPPEPAGTCVALPRLAGNTAGLLGVICLSKTTGKACFWDNQVGGSSIPVGINENQPIPGPKFSGGIDLTAQGAGECTSCHAGENPFLIHPGTPLSGFDTMANTWYKPLVNPDWPQNAGPTTLIDTLDASGNCVGCHTAGGSGGRFPEISTAIRGYCNDVLRKAVGNCGASDCSSQGISVLPTMPTNGSGPGSSANSTHVLTLINACDSEPKPIIRFNETTLNYGNVERGFSYAKGLVIHNDGNATLQVTVDDGALPSDVDDVAQWSERSLQVGSFEIKPGDPPLTLRQTYTPLEINSHSIVLQVESNDSETPSERITLTGSGVDPTPIDSVLVLDRSGSMSDSAGDRDKIEAMRDASDLYADLLRNNPIGETSGDKIAFVKYNDTNSTYMNFGFLDVDKRTDINDKLSDTALTEASDLKPQGGTGIGGAMQRAATILEPSPDTRTQVMVVLTDGVETETPYINTVVGPIQTANPDLFMFSVGLGDNIEPDKLQNISNTSNGYHQVSGSLSNENLFDLETFYFKIFAEAAGMDLVVDPTHAENVLSPTPVIVDTAKIISSDRSATFLVLDDPVLRNYYDLEFLTPDGDVIVPGVTIGGIGIQESSRHNYKIYRIVFPLVEQASTYVGNWVLRLTPNGKWNEKEIRNILAENPEIDYSGWLSPFDGTVPIGFAAAVSSDYRLDVNVLPEAFTPGSDVKLTANLTDRYWPAPNGSVSVDVRAPSDNNHSVTLYDDGSHGDETAGDAIWTNRFTQTATQGVYRFLFRSAGSNERGELGPREASRYVSLVNPKPAIVPEDEDRLCIPCLFVRIILALILLLLILIWYCTCWKNRG